MQRSLSKIHRAIANAPRYVTNRTVHTDFNIPNVSDVVRERLNKYRNKVKAYPSRPLELLLQPTNVRKLKRWWPLDLQGTWCDIVGWIPYHVMVIHGIVAFFFNHQISLYVVIFLIADKYTNTIFQVNWMLELILHTRILMEYVTDTSCQNLTDTYFFNYCTVYIGGLMELELCSFLFVQ
jgi:hypothetical protein